MDIKKYKIAIDQANSGKRLDLFLRIIFPDYSRSYLQKLIKDKNVLINGSITNSGYKLRENDVLEIEFIDDISSSKILAQNIPLDIIFEDDDLIVINKTSGMVVHPACGNFTDTLVNALVYHFKNLPFRKNDESSWIRPGLVHRLDKDTSGVIVIAKTDFALANLSKQFNDRLVKKTYRAIVKGILESDKGLIEAPIARDLNNRKRMSVSSSLQSRDAVTEYKVIKRFKSGYMLLEAMPKTGRTHQIRVHLKYIGCPILGDREYGVTPSNLINVLPRTMLHAYSIEFTHPKTKKKVKFSAEIPEDFKRVITQIEE
jgi:23S rRNA pseudouridine1911/1915/1917 synthase